MKKILMTIVVVGMAIAANAAATNWQLTCGNLKAKNGSAFSGTFELYATGGDLSSDVMVFSLTPSLATYNKYAFEVANGVLNVDQSYSFYYVLKDGGNQLTSATSTTYTALETGAPTIGFGNQATYTSTPGNWAAVPEPTSGLLMLLGVAGLALRRKRA